MKSNRSEAAIVAILADTARAPKLATVDPAALKRARAAIRRARFGRVYYAIGGILGTVLAIMAAPLALFVTADHGPYAGAAVAIGAFILAGNIIMGDR